jgi:hypothetical protein
MPVPDFAKESPKLSESDEFYYFAFQSLTTCRSFSDYGTGRIPWTSIMDYADRLCMDFFDAEYFREIIEQIDVAYVKRVNDSNG